MKNILFTIMISALSAMIVLGAALSDQPAAPTEQSLSRFEREAPASTKQRLAGISDKLVLEAKSAYWQGNYKLAAQYYHLLIKAGRSSYNDLYNLACCYSHMGNVKLAGRYLLHSVEAGFNDVDHIKDDPDFRRIKSSPEFQKVLERIGEEISQRQENGPSYEPAMAQNLGRTSVESVSGASATVSYGSMN